LTFPSSAIDSTSTRHTSDPVPSPTRFATVEIFLHRLLAFSSIPVDLFIPPYSTPQSPTHIPLQSARIRRIALHPEIPIVALAQAHSGGSIFLFDLRTNAYLKYKLALADNHQLNALVFSKYNLLAAGTSTGDILLFELNLSVPASTASKPIQLAAIPSLAALIPPQFPSFALLGEVTDLNFDHRTGRYLAIATTRSGTWIYDTVYSSSLRLSKYPSSSVAFSPTEDVLAVARERTGDIEFYTVVRAGTLTFSKPMVAKSGFKTTVTQIQWASNGKSLLYCNDGVEGIRILNIEGQPLLPPGMRPFILSLPISRELSRKHRHTFACNSSSRYPVRRIPTWVRLGQVIKKTCRIVFEISTARSLCIIQHRKSCQRNLTWCYSWPFIRETNQ
jgi:WD40 repeat protein